MSKFLKIPISPLMGSSLINYIKVILSNNVSSKYYLHVFLTFLVVLLISPFQLIDKIIFFFKRNNQKNSDPIFIVGHWRSGTTLLHNLLGLNKNELSEFLKEQLRNAYDLKEAKLEQSHPGIMREAERFFILQQLDTLWREHLQSMDSLRESVGLRGYGQKDPLIEYKNEGYDMFLEMMINMRRNVIYSMFMFQPAKNKVEA